MIEQCEHFDEDMFWAELEGLGQSADVEARVLNGDEERVRGVVISDVCEIGGPEFAQHDRTIWIVHTRSCTIRRVHVSPRTAVLPS